MTTAAPSSKVTGPKGQPSRIGGARPSHLVTTGGSGAIVDLPGMSVIVKGTESWPLERAETIVEPRLLEKIRATLGPQVNALHTAPWDPQDSDDPWTRTGVPVSPFPRWLRCPACHRLGPLDPPGQFDLVHRYGRRPDLAKFVHTTCQKQTQKAARNKRACLPARFLVACDAGHLDDFPYVDFVHSGRSEPCGGPKLVLRDSSSTLGPRVTITCVECSSSRNVSQASGRDGWEALPTCRGRHPHLQEFEPCGRNLRLMVLGASNLWFSITASALHLPQSQTVADIVSANWEILGPQPNEAVVGLLVGQLDSLRTLRDSKTSEVWSAIEALRASGGPVDAPPQTDLLRAEWDLLSHPTTQQQDDDFRAVPISGPDGYNHLLQQVVLVSRLREVQALVGFTRLTAPDRRELDPGNRLSLSRTNSPKWVPAFEQRGEGIFLELPEPRVRQWEREVSEHPRIVAMQDAFARWSANRDRPVDATLPIPRFLLLHTLSHLLIRQVALECGYGSSSIRERIYVGTTAEPATGILLSTAASDSEGTLGGLVALGQPQHLKRLLDNALVDAQRCSSDPICAEHVPEDPSDTLHAAACHACLFASETSCETGNRWLDRAVVVELTGDNLAFLR
ncbi:MULTISPECIES: DrmB family protein [unclassified Rhodococcus (in: high G+C Gram-positive bacteria)]|uniref:DrmB family protein n=1 Tax=unclassified Rhodococcus (in: high G+C Gram-positive bacteria) TaxID=192944 RepID=UPI003989BD18